jgi:hypothetical protein
MALEVPDLDTRTFDQLVEEAKRRIARYTPEWTDFNTSDPGITLVELFAWLTEITLFQLNQVPELTYVKFLDLLGLTQDPARPATAELTFTPTAGAGPLLVPARTQVSATGADGSPLVFETDQGLALIPYPLSDVVVDDGSEFKEFTDANDSEGVTFHPLGWIPQPGNALYLGFTPPRTPGPAQFPPELRLRVSLPAAALAGTPQRAGARVRPPDPPVRLVWEFLPAAGASWRRLNTYADDSGAFTRDGYLTIAGPAGIEPVGDVADVGEKRYWLRVRVASGVYPAGHEPEIDGITPNTTPARNLATVTEELLGVSDGSPNQTVHTRRKPVAEIAVEVRGDETRSWELVQDFLASGPEDEHFTLDPDSGTVTFGDGVRGLIPPAGAELVAVAYRYGGGAAGNLPAGAISSPLSALPGVGSVTNRRPSTGGTARQSLDELKRDAPALLRHQQRAVTADDYAALARKVGGVADAVALPVTHPDHPDVEVAGAVTVLIVADTDDPEPAPSAELIAAVCRDLEPARLLATELYVSGPVFVPIAVHATVTVNPYAAADAVAREAEQAVKDFIGPLHRQPDGRRTARFGRTFQPTGLYGALLAVPDVVAVTRLDLVVDGRPVDDPRQPVPLPPLGLPVSGEHSIRAQSEVG